MLNWEAWQRTAESSLEAARLLLDHGKPVEAVHRAYYGAYPMVTGVLIKISQPPRPDLGNGSHQETQNLFTEQIGRRRQ
jgi:uncharacterized protein (UPF0332 family)